MTKEKPIQGPDGVVLVTNKLQIFNEGTSAADAALGHAAGDLGVSFLTSRIKAKIISFAETLLAKEQQKPAAQQKDVVEFQLVIVFHQTSARVAKGITDAL